MADCFHLGDIWELAEKQCEAIVTQTGGESIGWIGNACLGED